MKDTPKDDSHLIEQLEALRRRIAERERTEDRYRALAEGIADGIIVHDADGAILDVNQVTCDRLGYKAEELLKMNLRDIVSPKFAGRIAQHVHRSLGDETIRFETEYVARDGRRIPCEIIERAVEYHGQKAIQSVARDITERKRMENALRKSEEKYRTLFEDSLEAMSVTHRGKLVDVNPAWLRMHGYKDRKDVIGLDVIEFIHPDDRHILRRRRKVTARQRERVCQFRDVRKDATLVDVEVYSSALTLGGREVILTTVRDITERKRAEEELRKSRDYLDRILNGMHEGVMVIDRDFVIRDVNQRFLKQYASAREDVIGRRCYEVTHGAPKPCPLDTSCPLEEVLDTRGPVRLEHIHTNAKGEKLVMAIYAFPLLDEAGEVELVVALSHDVTERKRLEEQLHRAQRMQSIGTLASGVAHNFNNILGIILGNAELLKMTLKTSSEAAEFIDNISQATERAAALAQQLLSVARRHSGDRTVVTVGSLVQATAQTLRAMLDSSIQIEWHVADDTPSIAVNQAEIEQLLINICLNARDAMPKGGTITIEAAPADLPPQFCDIHENMKPGRHACISIADTGTGMPPEILSRIFDPFFTTKDPDKGIGLGLATAYGTAVSHGGCLDVESQPGRGSRFRIYLPAAETKDSQPPTTPDEEPRKGTETVLVVDDEANVLDAIRRSLEQLGYTVLTAATGTDAIALYRREWKNIDLVLLDFIMPGMDGEDAFRKLKEINPKAKVVVSSGYDETSKIKPLLDAGVDGFVKKPYRLVELSRKFGEVLEND